MPKKIDRALTVALIFSCTVMFSSCVIDDEFNKIVSGFESYQNVVTTGEEITITYMESSGTSEESQETEGTEETEVFYKDGEIKENSPAFFLDHKTLEQIEDIATDKENSNAAKIINGSKITFKNMTVAKSGKSVSELLTKQQGLNSAVLLKYNSEAVMNDCEILTSDVGAPAFFVNGTGTRGKLNNLKVNTADDLSMGICATYNGFVEMLNNEIITNGDLSSGVYIGSGGGKVTATGGNITTNGAYSPAVYANGTFSATGSKLTAAYSPVIEIDGRNTVLITGSELMSGREEAVRIYQRENAPLSHTAKFLMTGGTITAADSTVFYVTNTMADIELQGVNIPMDKIFLRAEKNEEYGLNGADARVFFNMQKAGGDITADEYSTLDLSLKNGSHFIGSVNYDNTAKFTKLYVDSLSEFELTGDCYIDDFVCGLLDFSNIADNGFSIYYNPEHTKLGGETFDLPGGGIIAPYDEYYDESYEDYDEEYEDNEEQDNQTSETEELI